MCFSFSYVILTYITILFSVLAHFPHCYLHYITFFVNFSFQPKFVCLQCKYSAKSYVSRSTDMGNQFFFECFLFSNLSFFSSVKMDLREVKIKQELDQGNHFARIPEDLLIFILSKMKDLKYLCQCCLVSKRFNSSVYLIKTVSVALPSNEMSSAQSASELKFLFYKIFSLTSEEVNRFLRSSSFNWLKFLLYLQKFEQLELISLKFTCPANLCSSSFFNLKVRFSDSGTLIERLISIMPARVYKVNEHGYHFEPRDMRTYCKTQVNICCCAKWLFVLGLLLKCKPSLKSIVITNSNKPWTVVLNEKSLVAWRKSMFLSGCMLDNTTTLEKRAGVMSELRLPISGYVMNKVQFVIVDVKFPSHSGSSRDCATCKNERLASVSDDAMTWEFVDDKKIINEAVHEILDRLDRDV